MKLTNKDRIGSGGYGTVYRLTINDSTSFAVKKLSKETTEHDRGFERELESMGDIKHRNIVTLYGYYTAQNFNLLIYELMPNGSLDTILHGMSLTSTVNPLNFKSIITRIFIMKTRQLFFIFTLYYRFSISYSGFLQDLKLVRLNLKLKFGYFDFLKFKLFMLID